MRIGEGPGDLKYTVDGKTPTMGVHLHNGQLLDLSTQAGA
jgi:hypothetical protein